MVSRMQQTFTHCRTLLPLGNRSTALFHVRGPRKATMLLQQLRNATAEIVATDYGTLLIETQRVLVVRSINLHIKASLPRPRIGLAIEA